MQDLDYAEMLEIPVSTVTVTKKKSLFRRKEQLPKDDLKERVVDTVNERVNERAGVYVEAEDLTDPPVQSVKALRFGRDRESVILFSEIAAVCLIALAIFVTNLLMPNSAINTFLSTILNPVEETFEPNYTDLTLSSVVSSFSDADIYISDDGVLTFTEKGTVYPVCDGTVSSITEQNGKYVVKIAHTSTFCSVISGLTNVYAADGDSVKSNLPFAYSDGNGEVSVSLYDGNTLLDCLTLSGIVPVWKS